MKICALEALIVLSILRLGAWLGFRSKFMSQDGIRGESKQVNKEEIRGIALADGTLFLVCVKLQIKNG